MSVQFARNKAEQLLATVGIREAPVEVERIAKRLKLTLLEKALGDEVSGLLITNDHSASICVNRDHPPVRRRFTIAHEIGHFFLGHQFESGEHVHVDQGNYISARGPRSAAGIDAKEIEANQFAASLLMPAELLKREVDRIRLRQPGLLDVHVSALARKFEVSEQAMTIRLDTLGLL